MIFYSLLETYFKTFLITDLILPFTYGYNFFAIKQGTVPRSTIVIHDAFTLLRKELRGRLSQRLLFHLISGGVCA